MKLTRKNLRLAAACAALLFTLLTVFLLFVDRAPIGAEGKEVGLARANKSVFDAIGAHPVWHGVTNILGAVAILVAALFAAVGLLQWIRRRRLFAVDWEILGLGVLYLAVIAVYAIFTVAVVNVRPFLADGSALPEASFPSSHTMLACTVFGSAMLLLPRYLKNRALCRVLTAFAAFFTVLMAIGRLLAGDHWLTDVIGSVLVSASLLALYASFLPERK